MIKSLLSLFVLLLSFSAFAQTNISIGKTDSLQSKILNETRQLYIYLPENYSPSQKYPVAYLLDCETFFHFYTGITNHLSSSYVIPEMIVVGIVNTDRNRDYTPTKDTTSYFKTNGGGEAFTEFLESELIPFIETKYSTVPYRLLVGHSLGGLLVTNTFLKHPDLFNAYIALDPSLWWNNMKLNNEAPQLLQQNSLNGKKLFIGMSNSLPAGMNDTSQAKKDTTNATIGIRSIFQFRDKLQESKNAEITWKFKYYPDEFHGSVPLIGCFDGLKYIFDFYRRPSFQQITDNTASILEDHYKKVSKEMGYTILPPVSDISGLAWRCSVLEKNDKRALAFLEMYVRLYPEDPNAYFTIADYYSERGNKKQAETYLKKAKQLSDKANNK